jgi:hypothetical protein
MGIDLVISGFSESMEENVVDLVTDVASFGNREVGEDFPRGVVILGDNWAYAANWVKKKNQSDPNDKNPLYDIDGFVVSLPKQDYMKLEEAWHLLQHDPDDILDDEVTKRQEMQTRIGPIQFEVRATQRLNFDQIVFVPLSERRKTEVEELGDIRDRRGEAWYVMLWEGNRVTVLEPPEGHLLNYAN